MVTNTIGFGFVLGMLIVSGSAFAQNPDENNSNPPVQGQRENQGRANGASRVPPESAISSCKSKSEGTACEVSGPNGTKQGICVYTPDKKYFACRPNDMNNSVPPVQR